MNLVTATFLCLLAIAAILFVFVLRKNSAEENSVASSHGIRSIANIGTWWVSPLILWVVFLAILFFLFPHAWHVLWRNQALFWITQAVYCFLAYSGKDKKDWRGRPVRPLYKTLLIGCIVWLLIVAVWDEAHRVRPIAVPRVTFHQTTPVTAVVTEKSAPAKPKPLATLPPTPRLEALPTLSAPPQNTPLMPPPQQLPAAPEYTARPNYYTSRPLKKVVIVYPGQISTEIIPAGYHVSRIDGITSVLCRQRRLYGRSTEFQFKTKSLSQVEITIWYEPNF